MARYEHSMSWKGRDYDFVFEGSLRDWSDGGQEVWLEEARDGITGESIDPDTLDYDEIVEAALEEKGCDWAADELADYGDWAYEQMKDKRMGL